jgi:hypothetical protein
VSSTLTYVYCLVRSARPPSLRGVPSGLPGGGEVRVIDAAIPAAAGRAREGRQWLIVSSVPQRLYGEAALEKGIQQLEWVAPRAVAHEAVVEHFLSADAVLPMQLFTLFMDDARALQHVQVDQRRIRRILDRVAGKVEWGLRLTWDPRAGLDDSDPRGTKGKGRASGADYLARKRDLLDVTRARQKRARAAATRMYKSVSREALDATRRTATEQAAPGSRLLLDAAFLVPARREAAFRVAVRRHAKALAGTGLDLSLTGPWPAYNFI